MIPKIIHQIWDGRHEPLPRFFKELSETWKKNHPEWRYEFWDKERMEKFVAEHFPVYFNKYQTLKYNIQRWDVIRYMILSKLGGLYVDFDYESLKPADEYLSGKTCCFGLEPEEHRILFNREHSIISNAFIASVPNHPFMELLIENVFNSEASFTSRFYCVLETTGPYMISRVYQNYENKDGVELLPEELVSPLSKDDVTKYLKFYIDDDVLEHKTQKAIAIHYFSGTWLD